MDKGFWMTKGGVLMTDGNTVLNNSSVMEHKHACQCFSDSAGSELFPNKRQAVESSMCQEELGISTTNALPRDSFLEFQPIPLVPSLSMERLSGSEMDKPVNLHERNMVAEIDGPILSERGGVLMTDGDTVFNNSSIMEPKHARQWFSDSAGSELFSNKRQAVESSMCQEELGISMANALPRDSFLKFQPIPSVPSLSMDRVSGSKMNKPVNLHERNMVAEIDGPISSERVTNELLENDPSVGLSISYAVESQGTAVNCGGSGKPNDDQGKDPVKGLHIAESSIGLSLDQANNRGTDSTLISMGQPNDKEIGNTALMVDNIRYMGSTFGGGVDNTTSSTSSSKKQNSSSLCLGCYNGESIVDVLSRPVSSYTLLYEPCSVQTSETRNKSKDVVSNGQAPKSRFNSKPKSKLDTKPARKEAPNRFPSNVRCLLATGILDGMPMKYVSTTGEELGGIIKGLGYLCACQSCNYSKVLNAYEFERHAGCKTNHPNNHIYFVNGKSIYQIVQELQRTPDSMLFDAVETMTGFPVNEKAFLSWKESYQAAKRICRKEELNK